MTLCGLIAPWIAVDPSTPVATVARMVAARPGAIAVLIDASFVVRGTLALPELAAPSERAVDVLAVKTPMVAPESDLESARRLMRRSGVDRVLIVAASGQVLGVVRRVDLENIVTA